MNDGKECEKKNQKKKQQQTTCALLAETQIGKATLENCRVPFQKKINRMIIQPPHFWVYSQRERK